MIDIELLGFVYHWGLQVNGITVIGERGRNIWDFTTSRACCCLHDVSMSHGSTASDSEQGATATVHSGVLASETV